MKRSKVQCGFFDEIVVDSFAGGGGASTGIELAIGRPVNIAINHDPSAIAMHKRNHPFTEHYIENIWNVDPKTVTRGRRVKLAWFSPDCKHFSRAKGAALVDRKIRGLAWIVLRWAGEVKPDVIMLENVPEFVTWGPVRKGKPVKSKAGQTYKKWCKQLSDLGYEIETKVQCAADFGAPTIRTRFTLIARRDGKHIVWPEKTHAPRNSDEVKSGKCLPWRAAAEVIDFSLPCPSIFDSKEEIKEKYGVRALRPLKENTLKRIAKGLDKFVIKSAEPFIVECNHGGGDRNKDIKEPINTITAKYTGGVVEPKMKPYLVECNHSHGRAKSTDEPMGTITAKDSFGVADPKVMPYIMTNNGNNIPHGMNEPVPTITTANRNYYTAPVLMKYYGGVVGDRVDNPLPTVTAIDHNALIAPSLIQYHSEQSENEVRGQELTKPISTIDTTPRYGLNAAYLVQYFGGEGHFHSVEKPLATITTMEREGVTLAHLAHFKGKDKGQSLNDPLMTVTSRDGQFAQISTKFVVWDGVTDVHHWWEVRELLNTYCGYNIGENEILLFVIDGLTWFISDIGLRMLIPRELFDAMGFPHDYVIDYDYRGKAITRADKVAKCGNAVCPDLAQAMVRANLPEWCDRKLSYMDELLEVMTS